VERSRALELASEIAKPFESLRLEPYHDPVGFPTIGWGHLLSREKWAPLTNWQPITETEADRLLVADMDKALRSVLRLVPVPLTDEQCGALVDFTYNCGGGNLEISTLRKMILRGDMEDAANEFPKWCYAGGVKLAGLVRRRYAEQRLFTATL